MDREDSGIPVRVHFSYERSRDFKIHPANGVWGGVTPRGDFLMEFYVESHFTPDVVVNKITPEGKLAEEEKREIPSKVPPEDIAIRRVLQFGVLVSVEQALSIADWIKDKVKKHQGEEATK